jgi:hypothetical protein
MTGADDMVGGDVVRGDDARGEQRRRRAQHEHDERRIALVAVAVLCAVPFVMFGNLVSTFRLIGGSEEGLASVRTYEVLLVLAPIAFLVAMVLGARTGRRGVLLLALTMVPIVLITAYVFAVPQGRWHSPDGFTFPSRDVPACYSGTDSCAEYGG